MYRLSRIIFLTALLICNCFISYAAIDPHNGVAYVLLPKDFSGIHGVYRLNSYSDPYPALISANGKRIFDLNFGGAVVVNGLAVNQTGKIYLFVGPNVAGVYTPVEEVGWLPSGMFEPDSPAYVRLIGQAFNSSQVSQDVPSDGMPQKQYPHGTTNYDNDFWDYGPHPTSPHYPSGWPHTHGLYIKGTFTDAKGNSYQYKFNPYSPASHKELPLWNGPGAGAAGILHPTDPYKVILPNKWGGISWYAFGSPAAPAAHVGKLMDGNDGRDEMTNFDFRLKHDNTPGAGQVPSMSPYWDAKYISTVVRRLYEKRDRSLDLYAYMDNVIPPATAPYSIYPGLEAANMLTATDLKITEEYGKSCADGCIPGGALNPEAIGKIESCVQVFTSTTGRRYGFNPFGKKVAPFGTNDAALRVVYNNQPYNLAVNSSNIRNTPYFNNFLKIDIDKATIMGASSNFQTPSTPITTSPDHIYASVADKFCIQDSWWGNGGIAYEYYSKDVDTDGMDFKAGHIYRLNYLETNSPVPEDVGKFDGDVDAISVDGHGNLYILTTELDCPNDPAWPDPTGLPQGPDLDKVNPKTPGNSIAAHPDFLSTGSWMRPGIGTSDSAIAAPSQDGDYITIRFRQNVNKVARKYTPSAGGGFSMSTVEDRGQVYSAFDVIKRNLRYNSDGTFDWVNAWHHESGIDGRFANIDAEFAVVNIAERPSNIENDVKYSICRYDRTSSSQPLEEDQEIVFKVEGYRPYGADGNIQHLVNVGNIAGLGEVYVNLIPPYEPRDEDGDGIKGCFPSGMFENNSAYKLEVKYHVDLIDAGAGASYSEAQIIKKWRDLEPEAGLEKLFKFKFPQPGTYAVYASFKYYCFKYEDLPAGSRPDALINHIDTRIINAGDVQKVLYHVQSPSNTVSDGFISNIVLNSEPTFESDVNDAGASDYALVENKAPASFSFSFDAQFVRDANSADSGNKYETFDGIGVWDYGFGPHVYNWNTDGTVNMAVFNPGKKKAVGESDTAGRDKWESGTRVDEAPNQDDLEAITWRLLIYPPYENVSGTMIDDTPLVLGTGTCKLATLTDLGNQKYNIKVKIASESLNEIRTPLDPEKYKVRLELEYPRVTWHEHSHVNATGITQAQYRSIIPGTPKRGLVTNEPSTLPGPDVGKDNTPGMFAGTDHWLVCARDITILPTKFDGIDVDPEAAVTQIATHTTGDPTPPCEIKMVFTDNNPNSYFDGMQMRYELPITKRNLVDKDSSKTTLGIQTSTYGPKPQAPQYYEFDEYKIQASYTFSIPEYGGTTGSSEYFDPGKTFRHWVGSLSFSLEGNLYDGLGATDTNDLDIPHVFSKTAADVRLRTSAIGLIRYDNDPPSVRVNLVSQADNRRWEITLLEANKDLIANPASISDLASPTLSVKCFKINDASSAMLSSERFVTGSSHHPTKLNNFQVVDLTNSTDADEIAALPVIRRSSRLMVSVGIADNVDYLALASASVAVYEKTAGGTNALLAETGLTSSSNPEDDLELALKFDRGRHFVDMPMKVLNGQVMPGNTQIEVHVYAADHFGNARVIIVPIKIIDSTFDARVLESSENRN